MRILYFTNRDGPHDQRFLRALAATPHQVFALRQRQCCPETPMGITELTWPDGQPDWSHWPGWQQGRQQLTSIIQQIKPDLVHAGPVQGPALLTALAGFHPLVSMSWGMDLLYETKRSPWMRFAARFTLEHTDIFIGDCQTVAKKAASYGFPPHRMVLFPWGVDLDHFSPSLGSIEGQTLRKSLGWQDAFVVLCNRTWAPVYGVDVFAEAFVNAINKNQDLRLLLLGGGPQAHLIKETLAPVSDYVHFAGWYARTSLPAAYCAADLFVSPSHCDGSSVSLLEALACGRPVLVSDIPSNQEWVKPGVVGDVFVDGDVENLQDKLLRMQSDPHLASYGTRARLLAEADADWQKNFQKLEYAYQLAVEGIG